MRVVIVNRFPKHETYAARVCEGFAALGHECRYLGPNPVSGTPSQRIRVVYPPWRGPLPPLRSWLLDYRAKRQWRFDDADLVVDLHCERSLWVLPRAARRVRVVHRISGLKGRNLRARMRRTRLRWDARHGDRFIVHTPTALRHIAPIVGTSRVALVSLVGPEPAPRPAHDPANPPRLLFVGSARPEKGLEMLLAVAGELDWPLSQVGDGNLPYSMLLDAYAACDVLVCPYLDEYGEDGSGSLVVAEALAYAVPVVGTPAVRDLFPDNYSGAVFSAAATRVALVETLRSVDVGALDRGARADAPSAAVTPERYAAALVGSPLEYA